VIFIEKAEEESYKYFEMNYLALKLPRRKAGSWVLHPRIPINIKQNMYKRTAHNEAAELVF
jgi:hypothetical protein